MNLRLKRILIATMGIAFLGALGLFAVNRIHGTPGKPDSVDSRLSWSLQPFESHRYEFSFDSNGQTMGFAVGAKDSENSEIRSKASGQFILTESGVSVKAFDVLGAVSITDLNIQVGGVRRSDVEQLIMEQLKLPFAFRVGKDGVIDHIRFDFKYGSEGRSIVLALLGSFQTVLKSSVDSRWTAPENDLNGAYLAEYVLNAPSSLKKSKLRYLTSSAPGVTRRDIKILSTEGAISWSSELGVPVKIENSDEIEIQLNGRIVSRSHSSWSFIRSENNQAVVDKGVVRTKFALLQTSSIETDLASTYDNRQLALKIEKSILGSTSRESLLASLNHPVATGEKMISTELFRKIKAEMIIEPNSAKDFAAIIRDLPGSDPRFDDVSQAMSMANTPQAQDELRGLIEYRATDREVLTRAIPALAMVESPDEATEALIRKKRESTDQDIANSATLGLGIIGGTLQYTTPERASGIYQTLKEDLGGADNDVARGLYLASLGNLGHPEQQALVAPFLKHENSELRNDATRSLRFVPTDVAEQELVSVLQADKDSTVRQSAAYALSYRLPTKALVDVFIKVLKSDSDSGVGVQIVRNLDAAADKNSDALEALKWARDNVMSDNVRNEAKSLLATRKL